MSKKFKSWKDVPEGTKFKVVNNTNSHDYPMNVVLRTERAVTGTCGQVIDKYNNLKIADVVFVSATVPEMEEELEQKKKEMEEISSKIKFCKDNGLEEFDEETYRAYAALAVIESKKSKMEKVKAIAALLK